MVFQTPLPLEFRSGEFYERTGAAFYLSQDKLAGDHSPVRYQRELGLFRRLLQRGDVLDVGCGTGGFLRQLTVRFPGDYRVTGTDVAGPALDHAEGLGIPVSRGSFLDGRLPELAFDAVTFWAVLEHLPEPAEFLRQAWRVLKPGGWCVALVPNLDSLAVRLLGMKYRYILPQHLNYFTAATLARLFESTAGWEISGARFTHFNPLVILRDARGGGRMVGDEERARLLAKTQTMRQRRGLAPVRWAYQGVEGVLSALRMADNVVMLARKPGSPP